MSIIEAYNGALDMGDIETLEMIIHDDFVFNPHVGNVTMGKSDILGFVMSENKPTAENNRILYENDEVGVSHSIIHFSSQRSSHYHLR